VPGVRALVQPVRPPDDAPANTHRREALRMRRLWAPVRAQRRTQAPLKDPRTRAERRRRLAVHRTVQGAARRRRPRWRRSKWIRHDDSLMLSAIDSAGSTSNCTGYHLVRRASGSTAAHFITSSTGTFSHTLADQGIQLVHMSCCKT